MTRCKPWSGALNSDGYPVMRVGDTLVLVTRAVLAAKLGRPIRKGMESAHVCGNRSCVRASHLVEKTHVENCRMLTPASKRRRAA